MRKDYILPQTQAQTICVSQLMTGSGDTSIKKSNEKLNGGPGGMYV